MFVIPTLSQGGAERVVSNLSIELSKAGCEVIICLFEERVDYEYSGKVMSVKNCGIDNLFCKIIGFITSVYKTKRMVWRYKPDVVLSFMETCNIISILCKLLGSTARHILSVRVHLSQWRRNESDLNQRIRFFVAKYFYRVADKIIVNSELSREDLIEKFGLPRRKIKVIYNPVRLESINKLKGEDVNIDFNRPTIINHGRLVKQKGHEHLIKVFKMIKSVVDCQLLILGNGELEAVLKKQVADLDIDEDVHFLGFQKNPFKYISRSSLYILSSVFEGFPNSLLEAMACGIPVISFDCVSGPSEIIEDDEYGMLIPVGDEKKMAERAIQVLGNSNLCMKYGQKSLQRAKDFSSDIIIKEYEKELAIN